MHQSAPSPTIQPPLPVMLVVEDHEVYRRLLVQSLGRFLTNWRVLEANSIGSALEVLQHADVSVLVCDLTLPDGLATELLDAFPDRAKEKTKVVLLSNHSAEHLNQLALRPDVHGCMCKESGTKELARMIRRVAGFDDENLPLHQAAAQPT